MTDREWLEALGRELGVDPPSPEQHDLILRIAGVAAHASERTAAPSSTWMAARSGRPLADVLAIAARLGPVG